MPIRQEKISSKIGSLEVFLEPRLTRGFSLFADEKQQGRTPGGSRRLRAGFAACIMVHFVNHDCYHFTIGLPRSAWLTRSTLLRIIHVGSEMPLSGTRRRALDEWRAPE